MLRLMLKIFAISLLLLSAAVLYYKHQYAYHSLVHINPLIKTEKLVSEGKYADAQEYLEYFFQFDYVKEMPDARTLLKKIKETRGSFSYKKKKILEGVMTGKSDELSGQVSSIASDFLVVGDIRDLIVEGKHYLHDEKVDKILLSLSAIGLAATASSILTFGATSAAKSGLSIMKIAKRSNKIPKWLELHIIKSAKEVKRAKSIKTIKPLLRLLDDLYKKVGLKETLKLLNASTSISSLKNIKRVAAKYGKSSHLLIALSKGRLLREGKALAHVTPRTVRLASSYGESGFKALAKNGEKNFLKTIKRMKTYAKVGYRGEVWKLFIWLLKNISDTILIVLMALSVLLLLPYGQRVRK